MGVEELAQFLSLKLVFAISIKWKRVRVIIGNCIFMEDVSIQGNVGDYL